MNRTKDVQDFCDRLNSDIEKSITTEEHDSNYTTQEYRNGYLAACKFVQSELNGNRMRDYKNVVLMRFTGLPDLNGNVYAKDCKITFPERLDIRESYLQDSKVVGKAFNFKKENDQLLFDATIDDTEMGYNLLSNKKPGAGITCDPPTITGVIHVAELYTIALIDLHADPIIEPFSKYEIKEI